MKSLKSAARRSGIISAAALSALALASCSAGQISQTAEQVAAVDGSWADTADGAVAVRNVTVMVDDEGEAALRFTAINQDPSMTEHSLESVQVNGNEVEVEGLPTALGRECVLVADSQAGLDNIVQSENIGCIEYATTSLDNDDLAIAGNATVVFTFSNGEIELISPVSPEILQTGEYSRGPGEGRVSN